MIEVDGMPMPNRCCPKCRSMLFSVPTWRYPRGWEARAKCAKCGLAGRVQKSPDRETAVLRAVAAWNGR